YLKLAVTLLSALRTTVQVVAVPVHAPLQPVQVEVASGVAVRVTLVPAAKASEHPPPEPQAIPAGLLETTPFPARLTVNLNVEAVPPPPPPPPPPPEAFTEKVA